MRKVILFMLTSLDGYFEGLNREIDWHNVDEEFNDFSFEQLKSTDLLLFGRVTYEMMADFWPTQQAIESDPIIADFMNSLPKIVFSKTLSKVTWQNTCLIKTDFVTEISRQKARPGKNIFIFGSSDLAVSVIQAGLLDEIRILINPLVLGAGKPLFKGIQKRVNLQLLKTRQFKNGNILLTYRPVLKGAVKGD